MPVNNNLQTLFQAKFVEIYIISLFTKFQIPALIGQVIIAIKLNGK
jgi:hypothetical protein